ncbi:MAG: DNA-processing protein DprA [Steroidobacteraceae bacterium]
MSASTDVSTPEPDLIIEQCALARIPGLDANLLLQALDRCGSWEALLTLAPSDQRALGWPRHTLAVWPDRALAQAEADAKVLQRLGAYVIAADDPRYPTLLRHTGDAPAVLFVLGSVKSLNSPQLAMVGTRHPTALGQQTAEAFAFHCARAGFTITSGLARGIDGASHRGALQAEGITIAVLGTSLELIYPTEHVSLAEQILASGGALVSELPPGSPPRGWHFPRRNRLISGLSLATLVVEATRRSGSLSTARLALEQARDVFAIPGSIHNPQSQGCHYLLQEGAGLIDNAETLVTNLTKSPLNQYVSTPSLPQNTTPCARQLLDNPQEMLLDALGYEPTSVDALIASTGLSSESVASLLLALELEGRIESDTSGRYFRVMDLGS